MMHSSGHNSTSTQQQSNSNTANSQSSHTMQLNLSNNNQQTLSSVGNLTGHHTNSNSTLASSSSSVHNKNIPQMPPLSAVAYSHLHSVMGAMPIYDMGDYQHL